MKGGLVIGRVFLGILLVASLAVFTILFSIYQNIGYSNDAFYNFVSDVGGDYFVEEVMENEASGFNETEAFNSFVDQCLANRSVDLGDSGLEVTCDELFIAGESGLGDLLRDKIKEKAGTEIKSQIENTEISKYLQIGKWILIISGVIALILAIVMFFMSAGIGSFLISIGIVGAITGLLSFPLRLMDISNSLPDNNGLRSAALDIVSTAVSYFTYLLIAGAVLLLAGIILNAIKIKKERRVNDY